MTTDDRHEHERHTTQPPQFRPDRGPEPEDPDTTNPRLGEVEGDEGFPGPLIDTDHNMPGDQPHDARGPNKSELEGKY